MSSNNQNQAMQRFFEFVFNVPGDCFCCTWSISCFLETVEHMEGDRRWRSICTIGMSFLSLIIVFLLTLALCPKFYWSEINQIVMFNGTRTITHINYSSSTYQPTMYLNSTELNESFISATNSLLQSPINDIPINDIPINDIYRNKPYNLTVHHVTYQHIGLHLNLWHINYCTQNYTNDTYWKTYINQTNLHKNIKDPIFINNTAITTNQSCSFITYRESGTPSSTQDLSLWFIIFVIVLLLLGCICVLGTHPIFDKCHGKNTTLRSSIQKILAIAITILCACILNWSSFVFAAVFESQVESYSEWREKEPITQSNLGTGMLAVNGAMLLGIILSVIHCGAPIRTQLNINNNNHDNNNNDNNHDDNQDEEKTVDNQDDDDDDDEKTTSVHLTNQQRILLRHIPGGNSSMGNMAILTNPDNWFKSNNNNNNHNNNNNNNDNEIICNKKDNVIDINDDEFKEFEYQNMNINENINKKEDDDRIYNANLSMKRIRKKDKKLIINEKKQSLLLCDDIDNDNDNDDNKNIVTKLTLINCSNNSDNEID